MHAESPKNTTGTRVVISRVNENLKTRGRNVRFDLRRKCCRAWIQVEYGDSVTSALQLVTSTSLPTSSPVVQGAGDHHDQDFSKTSTIAKITTTSQPVGDEACCSGGGRESAVGNVYSAGGGAGVRGGYSGGSGLSGKGRNEDRVDIVPRFIPPEPGA